MSSERIYRVLGMTCEHCERAVCEEVKQLPGVRSARADRLTEKLVVCGQGFDEGAVRVAVESAGYSLAAR